MSRAVTVAGNRTSDVSYLYGTDGIRISAREDVHENGSTSTRITSYLIDAQNQLFFELPPSAFFLPIRSAASVASPSGNRHRRHRQPDPEDRLHHRSRPHQSIHPASGGCKPSE